MNLVAVMMVGNEADLIEDTIRNTMSLGVDAFAITDNASHDGTAEILARYRSDPRFDIEFLNHAQIYGSDCVDTGEIDRNLLRRAKERFKADWILRQDADEFWRLGPRGLRQICAECQADQLNVRRYNAVATPGADRPEDLARADRLPEVTVMRRPFPRKGILGGTTPNLPVNFSQIVSRPISRAARAERYGAGGHDALDASGKALSSVDSADLAIVHFWFTSFERFLRKSQFIRDVRVSIRPNGSPGWQWNRWGEMRDREDDSIRREYDAQFPTVSQAETLRGQGRLVTAARLLDFPLPADDPDDLVMRDLAALGWVA